MGRAQPFADFLFGKKYAVKDGDCCARHSLLGIVSKPQTGGTTNSKKRGFFPSRAKVAFVGGAESLRLSSKRTIRLFSARR